MAKLTREERNRLPDTAFALPNERKYPIPTPAQARAADIPEPTETARTHAVDAKARVDANGTEYEKRKVRHKAKSVLDRLGRM